VQVSVGGRWTSDNRGASVYRILFLGLGSPQLGGRGVPFQLRTDYTAQREFTNFTPRASVSYKLNRDLTAYAAYSEGFKSGGFDMRGDAFLTPGTRNGYGPEKVKSYEIGLKGQAFDNRLSFSAAAFYADYTDLQVTVQQAATPPATGIASIVANAAASRIQGVEFEGRAKLIDNLSLNVALGMADAKLDVTPTLRANNILVFQNTPRWNGSTQLVYNVPGAVMGGSLTMNAGMSFRTKVYQFSAPLPGLDQPAYNLYDANIAWTSGDGRWSGVLSGLNLSDKKYRVAAYNFPGAGFGNTFAAFYGDPRTFRFTLEYRY